MSRPTVAEINLKALANNWNLISSLQDPSRLIPVIKANAYGHGADVIAQTLKEYGAVQVAVALLEEAASLRQLGYLEKIIVLGPISKSDIIEAQQLAVSPFLSDKQSLLDFIEAQFIGDIHIKWNTGMNRLGLSEDDTVWLRKLMIQNPNLQIQAFCTHLKRGEDLGQSDGESEKQLQVFARIENQFPEITYKHLSNSDGFFANIEHQRLSANYGARPGISLYGYTSYKSLQTQKLIPVMTLKTKIVQLKQVSKGQSVSYNGTWMADEDSVIAVLPIGYADGYPRSLSNKGQVFVRGQLVPLVGIVCMDYIMIDVTKIKSVYVGDEVELWGKNVSLEKLASSAGTITYEMTSALTARVPRKFIR